MVTGDDVLCISLGVQQARGASPSESAPGAQWQPFELLAAVRCLDVSRRVYGSLPRGGAVQSPVVEEEEEEGEMQRERERLRDRRSGIWTGGGTHSSLPIPFPPSAAHLPCHVPLRPTMSARSPSFPLLLTPQSLIEPPARAHLPNMACSQGGV